MNIDLTDAETLEVNGEKKFDLLPPDRYALQIDKADFKENNKGTFLALRFEVIAGEYKRRKLFQDFLVSSADKDDKTKSWVGISKAKLKLLLAIAEKKIEQPNPEDFLGIKVEGTVTQDVRNPEYPKNPVEFFAKPSGVTAAPSNDAAKALQDAVNEKFGNNKSENEDLEKDPF